MSLDPASPGPGEPKAVLDFVVAQLEQLILQLTHFIWLLGSELGADFHMKTKTSRASGFPGPQLQTPILDVDMKANYSVM